MVALRLRHRTGQTGALALVMGDIDLVQALALADIRSAVFAEPRAPVRLSRHAVATLPWHDNWLGHEGLVESLLAFAATQDEPPVLYPQTDGALRAVSRGRLRLDGPFR